MNTEPNVQPSVVTVEETAPVPAHVAQLLSHKHATFVLAAVETVDENWVTPTQAAQGQGYFVDVTGGHADALSSLYREHARTQLPDGTYRLRCPTNQLAKLVADGMDKRAAHEGWTDTHIAVASIGSSSLDCRDSSRHPAHIGMTRGAELRALAFAGRSVDILVSRNEDGSIHEITLRPLD